MVLICNKKEIFNYCNNADVTSKSCDFFLGSYYFSKSDYEKSKAHFTKTLESTFKAKTLYALGRIAINENQYERALAYLLESEKMNCGRSYYWLGSIYLYALGVEKDKEKALSYFKKGGFKLYTL